MIRIRMIVTISPLLGEIVTWLPQEPSVQLTLWLHFPSPCSCLNVSLFWTFPVLCSIPATLTFWLLFEHTRNARGSMPRHVRVPSSWIALLWTWGHILFRSYLLTAALQDYLLEITTSTCTLHSLSSFLTLFFTWTVIIPNTQNNVLAHFVYCLCLPLWYFPEPKWDSGLGHQFALTAVRCRHCCHVSAFLFSDPLLINFISEQQSMPYF